MKRYVLMIGVLAGVIAALPSCSATGYVSKGTALGGTQGGADAASGSAGATPARRQSNYRELRKSLPGQSMSQVASRLGQPDSVASFTSSESWQYDDRAFDPISKRTVERLTVWFEKGVVEDVRASF